MLQQTRLCRSVVYEHGEHPVEQVEQDARRGIDEKVKKVIDNCIQRIVRTVRPIDVFVYLNLQKTRNDEMKDLPQPTLTQIQTFVKAYRMENLGIGTVTAADIKFKIKANMKHPNIKDEQGFYLGFQTYLGQTYLGFKFVCCSCIGNIILFLLLIFDIGYFDEK